MEKLFADKGKKIIVGTSLKEVNIVLKDYVLKKRTPLDNFEEATIKSLATNILIGSSKYRDYSYIEDAEAYVLFYVFLYNNKTGSKIFNLIPDESFSFATARNAYDAIKQIRIGKRKSTIVPSLINYVKDLNILISSFEDFLISHKKLDEPLILKKAIEIICDSTVSKDDIKIMMGINGEVSLYCLPSLENRTYYLEQDFLDSLVKKLGITINQVHYVGPSVKPNIIKQPTWGYSNEVQYIIDEIKKKKYNLNDVAIYVSNDSYNNLLKGYLENNKIEYYFSRGESILNEDLIGLFNSILDFLGNHFNIKYLYSIYRSPALGFYRDSLNNSHSYAYMRDIKNIKAQKEQILERITQNKKDGTPVYSEERKSFIADLVNIYDRNDSIDVIYQKVLGFLFNDKNYTRAESREYCKKPLLDRCELFAALGTIKNDNYIEKINVIKEIVSNIKIIKEHTTDNSYVLIDSITTTYLPRKYNFFVGLSSDELNLNEIESPLVSDEQLEAILEHSYYVKEATKLNDELNNDLNRLCGTADVESLYFITSIYDSVNFKDLSKSAFYHSIPCSECSLYLGDKKDIKLLPRQQPDNYIYPQNAENINKVNNNTLYATAVESIIECPLKFIYGLIYEDVQLDEADYRWFKGGDEGNFAHSILEAYFNNNKLMPHIYKSDLFEKVFRNEYGKIKKQNPTDNKSLQQIESNNVKKMVKSYLKRFEAEYDPTKPYQVLACELKIIDTEAVGYSDSNGNLYNLYGTIDRVDAYVDNSTHNLKIRIIDYKTYTESSYNSHKTRMVQCVIYPVLVKDYVTKHKAEIEKQFGAFNAIDDPEFEYELLKLGYKDFLDVISLRQTMDDAFAKFETFRKKPTWEDFNTIYGPFKLTKNSREEHDNSRCKYCNFDKYCKLKMQEGDNKKWDK